MKFCTKRMFQGNWRWKWWLWLGTPQKLQCHLQREKHFTEVSLNGRNAVLFPLFSDEMIIVYHLSLAAFGLDLWMNGKACQI